MSPSPVSWIDATDCDPPHSLDLTIARHANKVNMLAGAFETDGFDRRYPALIGYPLNGRIQLLSGTHRHMAASIIGIKIPVTLWLRSSIERAWGNLELWLEIMRDIPVVSLEEQ